MFPEKKLYEEKKSKNCKLWSDFLENIVNKHEKKSLKLSEKIMWTEINKKCRLDRRVYVGVFVLIKANALMKFSRVFQWRCLLLKAKMQSLMGQTEHSKITT